MQTHQDKIRVFWESAVFSETHLRITFSSEGPHLSYMSIYGGFGYCKFGRSKYACPSGRPATLLIPDLSQNPENISGFPKIWFGISLQIPVPKNFSLGFGILVSVWYLGPFFHLLSNLGFALQPLFGLWSSFF
ncbi:hypothetical protein DVH24_041832 [Malus domestica]|uniref:Uncharacterized protein n=1 Tax=Malus domestica TaxID=3750 RepID=A0A498IS92_MALDO|nr:hypothetical protein DVH24_041832 [Malus domestica]